MTTPVAVPRRVIVALIVVFLSVVAVGAGSMLYADYVNRESNQRWCGLVVTLDDAYRQSPQQPTTPIGKRIAEEMRKLRDGFGCER